MSPARRRKDQLLVSRKSGVVTLELAEPSARLTGDVHAALSSAAAAIDLDDEVRAVVLRGTGKAFCCGAEPSEDKPDGIAAIASLRVPVIAALHGEVLDEGLELAMACDLRVAAQGARLGLTQLLRGELPSHGGTQRLPRLVGPGAAMRLLLLGEKVTSRRALAIGLVSEVVERRSLRSAAQRLARALATRGPAALRLGKEAIHAASDLPLSEGLRLEGDLYVLLQTSEDRDEGIASFHERRRPRFGNR